MKNIALLLRYDGTAYHGWQSQKNAVTVQDTVSSAIQRLTGAYPVPELHGCGRTDAGVHALEYVASFQTESTVPPGRYPAALRPFLPPDISVLGAAEAPEGFHARFSCVKKEYIYRVYSAAVPDPFLRSRALYRPHAPDTELMSKAAALIVGRHDFSAFMATGSVVRDTVRTVFGCGVLPDGEGLTISVCADGFLYNMCRIIVGTLLYVSDGKLSLSDVASAVNGGNRVEAGITVPPYGLYLNRVWYGGEESGLLGISCK